MGNISSGVATILVKVPASSASNVLAIFSVSISAQQDYDIPDWVKNTAGWWADDQIDDASFVNGIKFLIENEF